MYIKAKPQPMHPQSWNQSYESGNVSKGQGSRNKIYVPIDEPIPNPINTTTIIRQTSNQLISELKRANTELKEKQQLYIDKLIKLQEGLQKQHEQFMQLQDLYNELFRTYKQKQQEISQLEMMFRESERKKNISHHTSYYQKSIQNQNEQAVDWKHEVQKSKSRINELQNIVADNRNKMFEMQKVKKNLESQLNYHKGKQKINDSRTSLNSKVFEELQQWQKMADHQKESRIKIQYENQFLKTRNQDLQNRIKYLQNILQQKQAEITKMRHEKINLHRENSESRLSRSRSPKNKMEANSPRKQTLKTNSIIDQLYEENKRLKTQVNSLKQELIKKYSESSRFQSNRSNYKSDHQQNMGFVKVRQQEFFSFSRDDIPAISSQYKNNFVQKPLQINSYSSKDSSKKRQILQNKEPFQDLEQLPDRLQVDEIIKQSNEKEKAADQKQTSQGQSFSKQTKSLDSSKKVPEFQFS